MRSPRAETGVRVKSLVGLLCIGVGLACKVGTVCKLDQGYVSFFFYLQGAPPKTRVLVGSLLKSSSNHLCCNDISRQGMV